MKNNKRAAVEWRIRLRISWIFFLIVFTIPSLYGQVLEVNGGSSSLYQAQGGTLTLHGPSYDASIGAGIVAGRLIGGANLTKVIGRSTYILGVDDIPFLLPTDVFDTSHYLIAQGIGVTTQLHGTHIFAFAGATSTNFSTPFFQGASAQSPAGVLFLNTLLKPHLESFSRIVVSRETTAITSLEWEPAKKVKIAVSGGVGANQPYGAGSVEVCRRWIDIKAAYIDAGTRFHRVAIETPLLSEPDRENVSVTVRPTSYLSFSGGRQNYLSPAANSQSNVRSSVDQASGSLQSEKSGLTASLYHSTYLGKSNNAVAFTANRDFYSRVHVTASYLASKPDAGQKVESFIANISETLTPRWNVIEVVNRSQGQTTVSLGGGFLSNLASITAEYETYYVPERVASPFEEALILNVQVHPLRGITLQGATFLAPDGKLRYTAEVQGVVARSGSTGSATPDSTLIHSSIGQMVIRGQVQDTEGQPVGGAALMIDQLLVYTNEDGSFYVRERKSHTHQIKILVDQFLGGGAYRVISAPATASSNHEENASLSRVIVQRVLSTAP